jgi:2,3-bisphosphoglycerate-dependent phosphoglycerate mutase
MPRLVLIRHGQSAWNLENRFTGWWDVDVTAKGAEEARAAGELMAARGLDFDICFTSLQARAIKTLNMRLEEMRRLWLPVEKNWRLNERHYGGLTGLNKRDDREGWRGAGPYLAPLVRHPAAADGGGQRVRPVGRPPLLPAFRVPADRSLKDTIARVLPIGMSGSPRRCATGSGS